MRVCWTSSDASRLRRAARFARSTPITLHDSAVRVMLMVLGGDLPTLEELDSGKGGLMTLYEVLKDAVQTLLMAVTLGWMIWKDSGPKGPGRHRRE